MTLRYDAAHVQLSLVKELPDAVLLCTYHLLSLSLSSALSSTTETGGGREQERVSEREKERERERLID